MSIGTTDIELREFMIKEKKKKEEEKKKKKKKMDKIGIMFSSNMKRKWYFSEIFHSFVLTCYML